LELSLLFESLLSSLFWIYQDLHKMHSELVMKFETKTNLLIHPAHIYSRFHYYITPSFLTPSSQSLRGTFRISFINWISRLHYMIKYESIKEFASYISEQKQKWFSIRITDLFISVRVDICWIIEDTTWRQTREQLAFNYMFALKISIFNEIMLFYKDILNIDYS
jgi:hypothetical protein